MWRVEVEELKSLRRIWLLISHKFVTPQAKKSGTILGLPEPLSGRFSIRELRINSTVSLCL